jgi:hypothetical protein
MRILFHSRRISRITLEVVKFLFILLALLFSVPLSGAELVSARWFVMNSGDDPRWASPDWNDQDWARVHLNLTPAPAEILWLRTHITLGPENFVATHPTGIYFAAIASHEIYWDGVLIGRGGKPARTSSEEIPGPIQAHYVVPQHLATIGEHVVAIRTSAHHRNFEAVSGYWSFIVGDYDSIVDLGRETTFVSLISLSGMILVGVFALLLFLVDRGDRSYLLLCLLAFVSALLLIAEAWRNLFGYPYNYHLLRLVIITGLTGLVSLLLLIFMMTRFPGLHGRWFLLLALIGFAGSMTASGWDNKALLAFGTGFTLSFLWSIRALLQKRRGSVPAILGLVVTAAVLLWRPALFADMNLYFGIDFLLLCCLAAHVVEVKQVRIEREEAQVKSARLEIELLRKHIQPHYLMNTLTALSEWIEEEPKEAVKMIEALSEEFRILSDVSNRSLIPLRDEIRLCTAHLAIMSRRKGQDFQLVTDQIDPEAMIPPAVIHTIVENAVVHNQPSEKEITFHLAANPENGYTRYSFTCPSPASIDRSKAPKEGTGFRYIKSRFRETYGNRWTFDSYREQETWKTEFRIPSEK